MTEASLTRLKPVELTTERGAGKNIEGWVELSYVISAEGKVTT